MQVIFTYGRQQIWVLAFFTICRGGNHHSKHKSKTLDRPDLRFDPQRLRKCTDHFRQYGKRGLDGLCCELQPLVQSQRWRYPVCHWLSQCRD